MRSGSNQTTNKGSKQHLTPDQTRLEIVCKLNDFQVKAQAQVPSVAHTVQEGVDNHFLCSTDSLKSQISEFPSTH